MKEYAEQFIEHHGIVPGDTLVGMSLGGMLACEISKALEIRQLVLISSGTRREHISPFLRRLGFLGQRMPFAWLQSLPMPPATRFRRRLLGMFREVEPSFLNWACTLAPWEGMDGHPNFTRIHGDRDQVFPFPYQAERIHYRLRRAAHLAVLERQKEVNQNLCRLIFDGSEHQTLSK